MTTPRAGGVLFVHDGHVLLLKRADAAQDAPGTWAFPGGGIEPGETPEAAARRELQEECGYDYDGPLAPLYTSSDGFKCYGAACDGFEPQLNDEHTAARWAPFDDLPTPLHPGMAELTKLRDVQHLANDSAIDPARHALDALWRIIASLS